MKIVSLHFKNLNSLKGEFKIDFSKPELANAGLFAITGPTGAGKSTILDAITLALYSFTPRLGDINKNVIGDKGVIVTKHTKEAFAHIVFEINGTSYKAEWAIGINRNGNWNEVVHKLNQQKDGAFISITEKKSATYNKIKEIIGLDENQFTKAIVLSQGKFDEFLKSNKNERYELLEIITGTQIYREVGKKVYQTWMSVNAEADALNNQMGGIEILTDDQILEIQEKKNEIEASVNELKPQIQKLEAVKINKEAILKLTTDQEENEQKINDLKDSIEQFKPELKKLENHDKALPLQVDYNNWIQAKVKIADLTKQIETAGSKLKEHEEKKGRLIAQLAKDTNEKVSADNFEIQLESFFKKVDKLDKEINTLDATLSAQVPALETMYKQIPEEGKNNIKQIRSSVDALKEFIKTTELNISKQALPADFSGKNYEAYLTSLNERITKTKELIDLKEVVGSHELKHAELSETLSQIKEAILTHKANKTNLDAMAEKLANELATIQNAVDANEALKSLEDFRDALEDGKPCPCCGSETHPYATNKPKINTKLEDKLAEKQGQCDTNAKAIREVEDTLLQIAIDEKNVTKDIEFLEKEIKKHTTLFNDQCKKLNLDSTLKLDDLKESSKVLGINFDSVKAHKTWNETKQPLLSYIELLESYNQQKDLVIAVKTKRANIFRHTPILEYRDIIKANWKTETDGIAANNTLIADTNKQLTTTSTDFEKIAAQLTKKVIENGFESIDSLNTLLLSEIELQSIKTKEKELNDLGVSLKTNKTNLAKSISETIKKDDISVTLEEVKINIANLSADRDKKLIESGELDSKVAFNEQNKGRVAGILTELEKVKIKQGYYATLSNLVGDNTGNKFNNIIQRITLRHLFSMTNQRLLTLMDRYQVDLGGEGQEDEIWVIDTHMGDEKRTINSVSGGERFVISLAMALALSDLASNNVKIDSMFIDEGFGSLSPDDLDNAITMLERMQVENEKTIGIISHVESLKERISTQIQVEKLQNGESTLTLKSNGVVSILAIS